MSGPLQIGVRRGLPAARRTAASPHRKPHAT